jgi:hypothetical protein
MALPATHIRFALDLRHRFPIENVASYISGTLYPDSRWLTDVDRFTSHASRYLEPDFPDSEYTFGIHIHCVCDSIQTDTFESCLPGLRGLEDQARWIYMSAAKMIQDQLDMKHFDLQAYLPFLDYAENPNQENIDSVKAFNRIIQHSYKDKKKLDSQDYYHLWTQVGLPADTAGEMVREMERMALDNIAIRMIEGCYGKMLERFSVQRA